tara:strand:- start:17 stop:721 length:705 start_codon:yes stop_codon:yes gene_type:complete
VNIAEMTWMQVEAYLKTDDRCVLPLGSTEQHAYISLATDSILSERLALEAAEPFGVPVFPVLAYGRAPYFMGYPGTVTVSPDTYESLLNDILESIRTHGFRRIFILNGHGGNSPACAAVQEWSSRHNRVEILWHNWWKSSAVREVIDKIDPQASHASWMETFPWTRVDGVAVPKEHKGAVELPDRDDITHKRFREIVGDGSFGGWYERPDEEMKTIWSIAVDESRTKLESGWTT